MPHMTHVLRLAIFVGFIQRLIYCLLPVGWAATGALPGVLLPDDTAVSAESEAPIQRLRLNPVTCHVREVGVTQV